MLRRLIIAAILAIALGAPVAEAFDRWDHTFQDGNDTETNLVIAALCVGVAFAIGTITVIARIRFLASGLRNAVDALLPIPSTVGVFGGSLPTGSPPTILRV